MSKRVLELDLLKSFTIVISMIGIHTMYDLSYLDASSSFLCGVLNVISSQFAAPVFMFCMGITLGFARKQSPIDFFRRGVILLTLGMVLNVLRYLPTAYSAYRAGDVNVFAGWAQIFNVDILQFAGLALMFVALLKKLEYGPLSIFVFSLVMSLIGTLLDGFYIFDSYVVNQVLGYFYPTPTCCCFPFLNWFVFVSAGMIVYELYKDGCIDKFLRVAGPIGTLITIVYMYLSLSGCSYTRCLENDWGYYSMHTVDALFVVFGIFPFMLSLFRIIAGFVPEKVVKFLCHPSYHINQYYCVSWIWIMWIANLFLFIPKATTVLGFLVMWFVIILLTVLTVVIYNRYLKDSVNKFFGRHSIVWIVGVWVVLMVFGAWYFTSVPGPYTMPY